MTVSSLYYFLKKCGKKIVPHQIKGVIFKILSGLRLRTMNQIVRELRKRGIKVSELNVLEAFARTGEWHTIDYAPYIKTLEAWEIDPSCREPLRINLPGAVIKITDSIKEVKKTKKKFSLIVLDNSEGVYGKKNEYAEHFDIFPSILRLLEEEGLIIINIFPNLNETTFKKFPYLKEFATAEWLRRRRLFYKTDKPRSISFKKAIFIYKKIIESKGFNLQWYFTKKRNVVVYYLVMKVKRSKIRGINDKH